MHCKINDEAHNKNRQKIVYAIRSTKWQKENKQHCKEKAKRRPLTTQGIHYNITKIDREVEREIYFGVYWMRKGYIACMITIYTHKLSFFV